MNITQPNPQTPAVRQKRYWPLILLVAATPALVCYLLITLNGYRLTDFMPNFSDEVMYWHQIVTFKEVGLNGGYFTFNEFAPAAEFTRFYTYGPWYPALYGTIARVIGWNATTTQLINSVLVGLALVLFCYVARLSQPQLWLTMLMLATLWSFILYFFTGMQEGFQQALAILLASIFVVALRHEDAVSIRFQAISLAIITLAAVMRLSWAILYLPFLLLTFKKTRYRVMVSLLITALLTIAVMLFSNYTGAPGNNSIFTMVSAFRTSFSDGLSALIEYFLYNLGRLFLWPKKGTDIIQTYQVLGLIVGLAAYVIQLYAHRRQPTPRRKETQFHLYNIAVTLLAALALYIVGTGGDQRLLVSHLLLSFLVMIGFKNYWPVFIIIFTNLIVITGFMIDFRGLVLPKYEPDQSVYTEFKQIVDPLMPYDPNARNAWCNTMLFSANHFDSKALIGLPTGIGVSFFYTPANPTLTFKSRYLFLDEDDYRLFISRDDAPPLQWLARTSIGDLYLNQGADCPATTGQ